MDRELKLKELEQVKQQIAAWPASKFDIDDFLKLKEQSLYAMDDAAFLVEREAALARIEARQRQERYDNIVREHAARRWENMSARRGELTRDLENNLPPDLQSAIERMESQVAARQEYGTKLVSFSSVPGGDLYRSTKGRTAADERATERGRQALEKLRQLALVPSAELPARIAGVIRWLAEADAADVPAVDPTKPARAPVPLPPVYDSEAVIEPELALG